MDFASVTLELLQGFGLTCLLFVVTLLFALPLGLLISFCTMSKFKPLRITFKVIVWIIRGVPLMLQIFIVYYLPGPAWNALNKALFAKYGIDAQIAEMIAVAIAFIINYACYFSEIFRGGIQSISKGQYEAGKVLGMTKRQIFRHVVLFQVVKRILAPMSNEVITLVKDTALANTIGVIEIIRVAKNFTSRAMWPLFYSAVFYLIFVGLLTLLFGYLEKKMNFYKE